MSGPAIAQTTAGEGPPARAPAEAGGAPRWRAGRLAARCAHLLGLLGLVGLSGAMLVLALPPYELAPLAWVALVPWLVALHGRSALGAALLSFAGAWCTMAGAFSWIFAVGPGFKLWHFASLGSALALPYVFFGLGVGLGRRTLGLPYSLLAPPAWVACEFLRGNALGFVSLPWAQIAHTQYREIWLIQTAALTGTYGISFLLVLGNSAIFDLALALRRPRPGAAVPGFARRFGPALGALAAIAAAAGYGAHVTASEPGGATLGIGLVQGAIQHDKWDPAKRAASSLHYESLTRAVARSKLDLIVWPETAIPFQINRDERIIERLRKLAGETGSALLVGSTSAGKVPPEKPQKLGRTFSRNSACLVRPGVREVSFYHKVKLFPFGEYMPLRSVLEPWLPPIEDLRPGEDLAVLEMAQGRRFAVLICWEIAFPDLVREAARRDIDFLVTISNDGYFGKTAGPYQHAVLSVFRAVEHRISVARCANTGLSFLVDPFGRMFEVLRDERGESLFVAGTATGRLPLGRERTFYTRHGDWLVHASIGWLVVVGFAAAARAALRRRRSRATAAEEAGKPPAPACVAT